MTQAHRSCLGTYWFDFSQGKLKMNNMHKEYKVYAVGWLVDIYACPLHMNTEALGVME